MNSDMKMSVGVKMILIAMVAALAVCSQATEVACVGDSAAAALKVDASVVRLGVPGLKAEDFARKFAAGEIDVGSAKAIVLSVGTDDVVADPAHGDRIMRAVLGIKHSIVAVTKRNLSARVVFLPIVPKTWREDSPERKFCDVVNAAVESYLARMQYPNLCVCTGDRLGTCLDWALGKTEKMPARDVDETTPPVKPGVSRASVPAIKDHWISDNFFRDKKDCKLDFRYEEKFAEAVRNDGRTYDVVMVGDSITHLFDVRGKSEWEKLNKEFSAFDLGFGGDHTENALWNILYGGFFDHIQGKVVTLMIGTNNRGETAEQVADGIKACVEAIKVRVPKATIFLHPMLPRISPKNAELRAKNDRTNELIKPLADGKKVIWVDLRPIFEGPDVTPERQKELLPDGTHPSVEGFRLWREAITPYLRKYAK